MTKSKELKNKIIGISTFLDKIKGYVEFIELDKNNTKMIVNLEGLPKNSTHGIHIHEAGDLSDSCMGACAHFNPYNKQHGDITSKERHVGDLGNITSDKYGKVYYEVIDKQIKLRGIKANIIGRSVVIHEDKDDGGLGKYPDSLTTGHSGKRIACSVIGYSKKMFVK
jgi:Cu-Zn family superoxide dismutase